MEKGWVKIHAYTDAIRGAMDKQLLEENGVPAVLLNKQDSSFMFGKIDLFVSGKDHEKAQRLLRQEASKDDEN